MITWVIGILIDLPNYTGWGRHTYDVETLRQIITYYFFDIFILIINRNLYSCLWDRKASHGYTLFFPLTTIIIPCCCVLFFYLKIYLCVIKSKRRVQSYDSNSFQMQAKNNIRKHIQISKGLFSSFALFTISW